jgi:hypothetical protein
VVVASIDTYLKYSEAVGSVPPMSKPAALPEAVMAENAALRAQLAASERNGARRRRARSTAKASTKTS